MLTGEIFSLLFNVHVQIEDCHSGLYKERCPSPHTYLVTVGDLAASKKEQQISSLKEELRGTQVKLTALREDSEQKMKGEQVRLELNREHAITGNVLPLTDM